MPLPARGIVRLSAAAAAAIHAAARAAAPGECCGFLLGEAADVRAALPATNRAAGPRFAIAPTDVVAAHHAAQSRGLALLGFYHSHPEGPAAPSAHDAALAWPGHVYAIAAGEGLRAWVAPARGAPFEEIAVEVRP